MHLFDYFFLTFRQFRTRKLRTFLTTFAIGIGVGATFLLVSFVYGVQNLITERIAPEETLLSIDVLPKDILKLDDAAIDKIAGLANVTKVSPVITLTGQAAKGGGSVFADVTLNGVEPDYLAIENLKIIEGRKFSGSQEVMLSEAAVKLYNNSNENIINQKLDIKALLPASENSVNYNQVQVGGGLTVTGVVEGADAAAAYLDLANLKKVQAKKEYNLVKVSVNSSDNMDKVKNDILAMGFDAQAVFDTVKETTRLFYYVKIVFACFGVIGLAVASIGMFNTLTISLLERTRDVGFMKAFGATNKDVMKLFLVEAAMMGLFGGLFGIILGYGSSLLINSFVFYITAKAGNADLKVFHSPLWFTFGIIIFAAFLGLITGFYPARRAAKISALEAIRYE